LDVESYRIALEGVFERNPPPRGAVDLLLGEIYDQRRRYDMAHVRVTDRMAFVVTRDEYLALQMFYGSTRDPLLYPVFDRRDGRMFVAGIEVLVR
jgi:hypothetical protein